MRSIHRGRSGVLALVVIATLVATTTTIAQSVIVPASVSTIQASASLNSLTQYSARTLQQGIPAAELTTIGKGGWITGLSFRASHSVTNPASWPAQNATWKNYNISLGEASVPISQMSTTVATNVKNDVVVRSGQLVVPAGTWTKPAVVGKPNPFDEFYFEFDIPYQYQGGDLVLTITHDGNDQASNIYVEYEKTYTAGFGGYAASFNATTLSFTGKFHVFRLYHGYAPAYWPGSGGYPPLLILNQNLVAPFPPPGTVNFAVTNGLGGAKGLLVVGTGKSSIALPNGCQLLVFPPVAQIWFNLNGAGAGNGRYDLSLKFPVAAIGVATVQAAILDSGARGGFTVTNGVEFKLKP